MNVVKDSGYPILGLDLWEHAYYLKYRNKRDEYVTNFWKCVNWEFVNSLYNSRLKKKINETENLRKLISETKSNTCSWPEVEAIRFIFNNNPNIKYMYRTAIDIILSEVFPEHYYKENEYEPNSLYGIYDLEQPGRSGINKLNTNYNTFCTLLKDINLVITREKGSDPINKINIVGVKPFEQILQTKKFIEYLNEYKFRIFSRNSETFNNLIEVSEFQQQNRYTRIEKNETITYLIYGGIGLVIIIIIIILYNYFAKKPVEELNKKLGGYINKMWK
jgi:hypothetical protein